MNILNMQKHIKRPLEYATSQSVGLDVYADIPEDMVLLPNIVYRIPTGVFLNQSQHYSDRTTMLMVCGKSGVTFNQQINTLTGFVDPDYRGEIMVMCHYIGTDTAVIKSGQKIAQLIAINTKKCTGDVFHSSSTRTGGFGSTGGV